MRPSTKTSGSKWYEGCTTILFDILCVPFFAGGFSSSSSELMIQTSCFRFGGMIGESLHATRDVWFSNPYCRLQKSTSAAYLFVSFCPRQQIV